MWPSSFYLGEFENITVLRYYKTDRHCRVQSANASGIGAGAGVSGDSLTATINELNKMYGTDVKQNFTLKETSAECLEIMNNTNSAEFFAFYAGPGALYNRQRRNILLQPFAMTACDTSLISV